MPARPTYILSAAGFAAGGSAIDPAWLTQAAPTSADAAPIPLKPLLKSLTGQVPRVASRFAELAVIGAVRCLRERATPLTTDARVYLATGLGDIARTDALYYQVMPPQGEAASPAHFATSGNNMAAFFVAQQANLRARNITVSADALSFEAAIELALADLDQDVCPEVLVGGVDETTVPREFYTRRFPLTDAQHIGEGSGWLVLGTHAAGAIGELLGVRIRNAQAGVDSTHAIAQALRELVGADRATLLRGCRMHADETDRIATLAGVSAAPPYLPMTGMFPTAIALSMVSELVRPRDATGTYVHVNRDDTGRVGLLAFRAYA